MAIIRAILTTGALLTALHAVVPAQAQSGRSAGTPLQLVPGSDQATGGAAARATPRSRPHRSVKKKTDAAGSPHRPKAQHVARPKAEPTTAKTAAKAKHGRSKTLPRPSAQQAITAAVPDIRKSDEEPTMSFAPMPAQQAIRAPAVAQPKPRPRAADDHIMRDGDSVSLIGRLPWWRNDSLQPVRYGSEQAQSKVMSAADAWLTSRGMSLDETEPVADSVIADSVPAPGDDTIVIADAGEVTAVDSAFATVPAPAPPAFWHSLLAILGGALAAAAVAVGAARYLFA